jgi:hypothetical protein
MKSETKVRHIHVLANFSQINNRTVNLMLVYFGIPYFLSK